ncbi:MAG: molybdopterin synthase catalytic subunit/molybdopterin converting factor small subunit [Planctomycetota bacterium]|jgi:molybdopterin synthase catalytic subunit/molybdopterin converting factor small subunit
MQLRIALFAILRERSGRTELVLEDVPDGTDLRGLKQILSERHPELGDLEHIAGVVGTDYVDANRVLLEGDEVALLPPVSGGDSSAADQASSSPPDYLAGVFELSELALDVSALSKRVAHPSCGAVLTFTGMTRETNRGQDVQRLDYEAFHAMTGPEMKRIFDDCRGQYAGDPERALRMLCAHRVGTVEVGEASVVIAVASPHRDAAFEAARFLIDTLKERLPVWKKEVYSDGHHWIGDRS